MKIIAVNISDSLSKGNTVANATRRAWKLNIKKASGFDKVIGVSHGSINGYFNLVPNGVSKDRIEPDRVCFILSACTPAEIAVIDRVTNRENLSRFVTKYIV